MYKDNVVCLVVQAVSVGRLYAIGYVPVKMPSVIFMQMIIKRVAKNEWCCLMVIER